MKESLSIIIIGAPLSGRAPGFSGAGGNQMVRGSNPLGAEYFFVLIEIFLYSFIIK